MRRHWSFSAAVASALILGCGRSGPALVPISGTVTLDGVPLEGATIVFVPDPSNRDGLTSSVVSDAKGSYVATTEGRSGLVPGKYNVILGKSLVEPAAIPKEFEDDPFMASTLIPPPKGGRNGKSPSNIEEKFTREVTAAESVLDFNLKANVTKAPH